MGWFKRLREGIQTATTGKKEIPGGLWHQCTQCKETTMMKEFIDNYRKCPKCDYHVRIGSRDYFEILFDNNQYTLLFEEVVSKDLLNFVDTKTYPDRLRDAQRKTGLTDAISVGEGKVNGFGLVIACMDFSFIGGSMGSVVGERIVRAIDRCVQTKMPFLLISKSGGARMMESAFSLMQMAKTAAKLTQLAKARLPYLSLMTDPTTGGVTASYSMLGDINMSEPCALIGFAGPRVIRETIKRDLPEGFQTAEFLLDKGFLDFIVNRKDLKGRLTDLLEMFQNCKRIGT
jgi:acetyl-CoA carboxylase carboxyl transferase subunit beta